MISCISNNSLLRKLNNNWIFEFIIVLLYICFGILGWYFSYSYGGMGIISLSLILLLLFNDFKYIIPAGLVTLFSYNGGYEHNTFPSEIALYAGLLIFIIFIFSIFNFKKDNFKKPKSYIGIMLLSISCVLPIFWNNVITEETKLFYFIYLSWILYAVLYFAFGINLGKNSLRVTIYSLSSLVFLINFECLIRIMQEHANQPALNIFSFNYSVGWGICNEAGIMLCFCMPFVFYLLAKTKNSIMSLVCSIELLFVIGGLLLTTSRGALLFGGIEFIVLCIVSLALSQKKITNTVFMLLLASLVILFVHLNYGFDNVIIDIKKYIFKNSFDDNGRVDLFKSAISIWKNDGVNIVFGSGIVSEIEKKCSFDIWDTVYVVYHSTFFETLVMGGLVGVGALLFHFFEKYKQLWKKEKAFAFIMLVGYLAVDAYGMIDNTYGMYYYMVPLVILMASADVDKNTDIFINEYELRENK